MSSINLDEGMPAKKNEQPPSFLAQHWQKLVALTLWLTIGGSLWWYAAANNLTPIEVVQSLADLFQSPFGVLIYILVYAIRPLLLFSAVVITLAGGSIFGPFWGVLIVIFASNTSAMIAYLVGRYFGEGLIEESDGSDGLIQRYAQRLRDNSFETVLIMRLIFLPYDLVNYLCGFLKIDWKAYIVATALGSVPGTIAFVLFGASLDISEGITEPEFNPWTVVASVAIVIVSIAVSRYMKKREGIEA